MRLCGGDECNNGESGYVYAYIYIERERERARASERARERRGVYAIAVAMESPMCVYIYCLLEFVCSVISLREYIYIYI